MTASMDMEHFISRVVEAADSLDPHATLPSPRPAPDMSTMFRSTLDPTVMASGSQVQHVSDRVIHPALMLLKHAPFLIPFDTRVKIFREFVRVDRERLGLGDINRFQPAIARATIHRTSIFEDGYTHLNALGPKLKGKIAIQFVSDQGLTEAGIDGGGVFKEFLTNLSTRAFDPDAGLFEITPRNEIAPARGDYAVQGMLSIIQPSLSRTLRPNHASSINQPKKLETQLNHFEFLGRILGKALYEGILVNVPFAEFFLSKWLGRNNYLDDLPSLDAEVYRNLIFLKNYQGRVEDLGVTFSVSKQEFGQTVSVDLIPSGSSLLVSKETRIKYIYLVANYKLNIQISKQCRSFFKGLSDMIDPRWIQMFSPSELKLLVCGTGDLDLQDLQRNLVYDGGFSATHPTILLLWNALADFDDAHRRKFIKFVTSAERAPLLGFKELYPKFCIRMAGEDVDRLPSASTCVNLLKLPAYNTYDQIVSCVFF